MPTAAAGLVVEFNANTVKLVNETKKAQAELRKLMQVAKRENAKARRTTEAQTKAVRAQTRAYKDQNAQLKRNRSSMASIGKLVGTVYAVRMVANFAAASIQAADSVRLMHGRMRAVSGDAGAFTKLVDVAQELGSTIDATSGLFTKLAIGTAKMGASTDDIANITKAVLQLGRVSGLSFDEVNYFSRQLGQGIASQNLAGDELRSLRENLPVLAQQLAVAFTELETFGKGVKITAGDLKRLGKEGKLGASQLVEALQHIANTGVAQRMFDELPNTFEQASNRISNEWQMLLAAMTSRIGQSGIYDVVATKMGESFKEIAEDIAVYGGAEAGVNFAQAFVANFISGIGAIGDAIVDLSIWGDLPDRFKPSNALGLNDAAEAVRGSDNTFDEETPAETFAGINFSATGGLRTPDQVAEAVLAVQKARGQLQRKIAALGADKDSLQSVMEGDGNPFQRSRLDSINKQIDAFYEKFQAATDALKRGEAAFKRLGVTAEQALAKLAEGSQGISDGGTLSGEVPDDVMADFMKRWNAAATPVEQQIEAQRALNDAWSEGMKISEDAAEKKMAEQAAINRGLEKYQKLLDKVGAGHFDPKWQRYFVELELDLEREKNFIEKQKEENEKILRDMATESALGPNEGDGGTRSAGSTIGRAGFDERAEILADTARMWAEINAYQEGGAEGLRDYQDQLEITSRVIEATHADSSEASVKDANEVIEGQVRARRAYEETINKQAEMSQFAIQAARNMQTAFASYLFDPFENSAQEMLKQFIDVIRQMIAEMVAFKIFDSLGISAFFGGGKIGAAATGGPVKRGAPYLVGEKGPEIVVPGENSFVIPNHKIPTGTVGAAMSGEAGIVVNQNIDARGNSNIGELMQLMPEFAAAIKRDLQDARRRGRR